MTSELPRFVQEVVKFGADAHLCSKQWLNNSMTMGNSKCKLGIGIPFEWMTPFLVLLSNMQYFGGNEKMLATVEWEARNAVRINNSNSNITCIPKAAQMPFQRNRSKSYANNLNEFVPSLLLLPLTQRALFDAIVRGSDGEIEEEAANWQRLQ